MGQMWVNTTYTIAFFYQLAMVACSCIFLIIMQKQAESKVARLMNGVAILVFLQNLGYLLEINSKIIEEAVVAIRVEYISAAYVTTVFMLFVFAYCNKKIPKVIECFLLTVDLATLLSVWMSSGIHVFWKSVSFVSDSPIPHFVSEQGILNYIFYATVYGQMIACIVLEICVIIKAGDKEKKGRYTVLLVTTLIPFSYSILGATKIFGGFNPIPSGLAMGVLFFTIATVTRHVFDVPGAAQKEIIKNLDFALIITDHMLGFLEANETAWRWFPEMQQVKYEQRICVNDDLENFNTEVKVFEKNGRFYERHISIIWGQKRVIGYALQIFDITDSRRQLENMENLKNDADRANNAKTDFLARMSHEIRTPINSVLGMNEMILRESSEEHIKKYSLDIKSAANTLLSIINDILDTTKIEAGKMEIVPVRYEISSLFNDLINMTKPKAAEKKLQFGVEIDSNIPAMLYGDDIRIRQVVLNLLSNAVKYTTEGTITLRASANRHGDKATLHFEVEDTGTGIKEEDMPKLFQAFERINIEQNRNVEGTGLGMNIAIKLLSMMGSRLEVESEYGKGSRFWFDIEQKVIGDEVIGNFEQRIKQLATEYDYEALLVAPDAKVLVVDDNAMNRKVFKHLVKETQIQVTEAESGPECLGLVACEKYDIIFLDHMMPDMDGIETLQHMNKMPNNINRATPIVMLTANAIAGAREQYLLMGFAEFLSKPIIPEKLETLLRSMLKDKLVKQDTKTEENEKQSETETIQPTTQGDLGFLLSKLQIALGEFDYDKADELINTLQEYSFEEPLQGQIRKLVEQEMNLQAGEAIATIKSILNTLS